MLQEMLETISKCNLINNVVIVSRDESAFKIGKKFKCVEINDEKETSVNDAVSLANNFLIEHDFSHSIVLPQDIPLVLSEDIDNLLKFCNNEKFAIVVPSRHFDGTNALVRTTNYNVETRYDEGSYKFQFEPLKMAKIKYSLAFIHMIMIDIDSVYDANYALKQNIKHSFCKKMESVFFEK